MTDDQQTPPTGPTPAPDAGSTPPQPGWSAAPAGWPAPPDQPPSAWPAAPQQPAPGAWPTGQPTPNAWSAQQQGYPGAYPPPGYPPQPGYPPPGYGQPMGYPPAGYGVMPQYAGFWIRLVAYIIDSIIWAIALVVAVLSIIVLVGIILTPLVFFGYWWYFWWKGGATPGMKMLGLRVVRAIDGGPIDGGMAALRALVFYAEVFFSGWLIGLLGFIWAAFEPRKRAWHDMAAGTVVIHTN